MKNLGTKLCAAGIVALLSIGSASAQGAANSGVGDASQKNAPSTAGVSAPGGGSGSGMKIKHLKRHHHHRHHKKTM